MATVVWLGKSAKIAQVGTIEVAAYDASTTYTLTINDKDISEAGDTDVTTTAANLVTAWNASTEPEHEEITASSASGVITFTADTAGTPFTVSASVSGGTGTVGSYTAVTANKSPNDWADADNWSGGAVPVNSDNVIIENADEDRSILYGLAQSAVTLTTLTIRASFTGYIGLPSLNDTGSNEYYEYRATHLAIASTNVRIGEGEGNGSGRIKLDTGSAQTTLDIYNSDSSPDDDLESILWKGTHASNAVNVNRGSFGAAVYGGEVATIATLKVGFIDSQSSDSEVRLSEGCTLTTITQNGGTLEVLANATTINKTAGELITRRSATVTTLNEDGGLTRYYSDGTITTLRIGTGGTVDFSQDIRAKTITNAIQMYASSAFLDPNGVTTQSAGFKANRCTLAEITIDVGVDRTFTVS